MKTIEQILNSIEENIHYFEARAEADEYNDERDVMKLSIGCTLHFYDGHTPKIRALMPQIVKSYFDKFGHSITGGYMINKESQKQQTVKISQKLIDKCLDYRTWQDTDEAMSLGFDNPNSEATTGNQFGIFLENSYTGSLGRRPLSYLHVAIPWTNIDQLNKFYLFIKEACFLIPLHSGYGGYWLSLPDQFYSYQEYQTSVAYRFYGCEIDSYLSSNAINRPPLGIKGINWLTILGNQFVSQMGGEEMLTKQAHQYGLGVERAGDNIIIQAGEYPDICDNEDLPMNPYYVAVNHLLKPIRKQTIGSLHMGSMTGAPVMDDAASDEWLRRFDKYPMPDDITPYKPIEPEAPTIVTPPSRYTGYKVAVGEVCQETGYYECPRLQGKTIMLMHGQTVLGDKHNEMGAIIWYKLTEEAERDYLDNRKTID